MAERARESLSHEIGHGATLLARQRAQPRVDGLGEKELGPNHGGVYTPWSPFRQGRQPRVAAHNAHELETRAGFHFLVNRPCAAGVAHLAIRPPQYAEHSDGPPEGREQRRSHLDRSQVVPRPAMGHHDAPVRLQRVGVGVMRPFSLPEGLVGAPGESEHHAVHAPDPCVQGIIVHRLSRFRRCGLICPSCANRERPITAATCSPAAHGGSMKEILIGPAPSARGPEPMGIGFTIGWVMFRLIVWGTIAVWIHPRLLDLVGGHGIASWLEHHGWIRILAAPPLGLLGILSAFEAIDNPRQRAAGEALARSVGGTLVEPRGVDPTHGISDGPGLRVPLGRWSMEIARWKRKTRRHTIASVQVQTTSEFSFDARGTGREPAMLRGLQQSSVAFAMHQLAHRNGDPRTAAAATTLAYLAGPPIPIHNEDLDRTVVLRSNQPDAAGALFRASAVTPAIAALNARTTRWDWTFYPTGRAGAAEMQISCPGALEDAESLRLVQAPLRAALEHLADTGVIAA